MSYAIKVAGLGKKYRIRHQAQSYKMLRETLADSISARRQKSGNSFPLSSEEFWALRDINFEIKQGDRVGIIGRNGAGKSTLLKILSRITEPTTGEAIIRGKTSSLLEVGTGFHPELTGRENIYLNGAIMGMKKQEIKKRFDDIVAFAEIERFLDTPVKHYSSGMYVRLAFAVAAHLEPDNLIIDEVLAVGDAEFQKKCLGRMEDIWRSGKTLLLVSHNMPLITSLCNYCILLKEGRIIKTGPTRDVMNFYYKNNETVTGEVDFTQSPRQPGDLMAKLLKSRIRNNRGEVATEIKIGEPATVEMEYRLLKDNLAVTPNFHFYNSDGVCVFVTSDVGLDPQANLKNQQGTYLASCHIPADFLNSETYYIGVALTTMRDPIVHFNEKDLLMLRVVDPISGVKTRGEYVGIFPGTVRPLLNWKSERIL